MLAYVPVRFDLFRTVRRHLHWTLQNLIAFANNTGQCFPSVRKLSAAAGMPRSTVSRHLVQLVEAGVITRQRRLGGVYSYTIAARFLPAQRGVSHQRAKGVPRMRREEKSGKKTMGNAGDSQQWEQRLTAWHKSGGKFWNAFWGPKPGEAGCWAPLV